MSDKICKECKEFRTEWHDVIHLKFPEGMNVMEEWVVPQSEGEPKAGSVTNLSTSPERALLAGDDKPRGPILGVTPDYSNGRDYNL